jgi:hypothetical protein
MFNMHLYQPPQSEPKHTPKSWGDRDINDHKTLRKGLQCSKTPLKD